MTLGDKQRKFAYMVSQLIQYAYMNDYAVTFGRAYVTEGANEIMGGMPGSLHTERLAIDFNLFERDLSGNWQYLTSSNDHLPLGQFWEALGGTWGGRFDDGNHYSLEHKGKK